MKIKGQTFCRLKRLSSAGLLFAALATSSLLGAERATAYPSQNAGLASVSLKPNDVERFINLNLKSGAHPGVFNIRHEDHHSDDQVITGRTYHLPAGESTNGDVVVIHGHARIEGIVNGDLALIGSDAEISGTVNGDVLAVAAKVHFAPGAVVNGDFSSVVSAVQNDADIHVSGSRLNMDVLPADCAVNLGQFLTGTIFLLRPMSPDSFISWVWAFLVLGLCLAIGHFFPKPVAETGTILKGRAPASLLCGLAILPAAALLCFLLLITVVGIVAIPLILAAVLALALVGNAVVFQMIGQRIAPQMSAQKHPTLIWIALGAAICWVVYCIPVIGFVGGSIVLLAGLGSFSLYLIERSRTRVPVAQLTAGSAVTGTNVEPAIKPAARSLPLVRPTSSADFWPRLGANAIDFVIIVALLAFIHVHRVILPAWVIYRFGMYVWRSATIGELALGLRVQRLDGTLITGDYGTAIVRALSSLLSLLPLGLGFFWTLFDPARETWHDKITNTQVVSTRPPRSPAPPPPAPKPESGPGEPPLPPNKPEPGPSHPPIAPTPEFKPVEPPSTLHKPEPGLTEPPIAHRPEPGPVEPPLTPAPEPHQEPPPVAEKPEFRPVEPPLAPKPEPGPEEKPPGT